MYKAGWLVNLLLTALVVMTCVGCLPSDKSSGKACKPQNSPPTDVSIQTIEPYFKVTLLRIDEIPLSETRFSESVKAFKIKGAKTVAADIAFESRSSQLVWVNFAGRGIMVRTTSNHTWKKVADLELGTSEDLLPSTGYEVYYPIGARLSRSGRPPEAEHSHFAGADPTDGFALLPSMNARARLIFVVGVAACKPYSLNLVRRDTSAAHTVRLELEAPPQFPGVSPSGTNGRAFEVTYQLARTDQASWAGPADGTETLSSGFHWQHIEIGMTNDGPSIFDVGSPFPMLLSAAGYVHLVDHLNVKSTQRLLPTGQSAKMDYYFLVSSSETSEIVVLTTFDNNSPDLATQTQSFAWAV